MATLTNEQIEQKKLQFLRPCGSKRPKVERKQLAEEVKALKEELVEAGVWPLDEDDLDKAAGGGYITHTPRRPTETGGIKEPWRGIIK